MIKMPLVFREWEIIGGVLGTDCAADTESVEKCELPVLKDCIDRNKYCSIPVVAIFSNGP